MKLTITNNGENEVRYDMINEDGIQPGETVAIETGGKLELREMGLTVEPPNFDESQNVGGS